MGKLERRILLRCADLRKSLIDYSKSFRNIGISEGREIGLVNRLVFDLDEFEREFRC